VKRFQSIVVLCFTLICTQALAIAQSGMQDQSESETSLDRSSDPLARIPGQTVFEGLELYWRNLYALSNIQRRYTSRDPNLATQAERLRVGWERRFGTAAEAMMREGELRNPTFPETFAETRKAWQEEETSMLPDASIAADFVARAQATLEGNYFLDGISPLLAFVPEYRETPHKEFDDNFWIVPQAFVIERRNVTEDRGGITSAFNGTAHSPWVWIRQPMSWGYSGSESRMITHDANNACGEGPVGVALLAEALSPLQLNGIENPEYRDSFMQVVRTNTSNAEGFIRGPWNHEPLKITTRSGRIWYTFRAVSVREVPEQSQVCVVIDFHVSVIDGWLQYIGTRYAKSFPLDHEITIEDAQSVISEMARYEPLFERMVNSVEVETYTESRAEAAGAE